MLVRVSFAIVTSQNKLTVLTLLNYEATLLRDIVYRIYTIAVTKSVGPWQVFTDNKVRTTATVVDTINN